MGVTNRDFVADANGAFPTATYCSLTGYYDGTVAAGQTNAALFTITLPEQSAWQLVDVFVHAKTVSGTNTRTVQLRRDNTTIAGPTTVVQGSTVKLAHTPPVRVPGGTSLTVAASTGASTTIGGVSATCVFRPFPLGEAGVVVP